MWRSTPSPYSSTSSSSATYNLGYNRRSQSPDGYYPIERKAQLRVGDRVIVSSSVGDAKTGVLKYVGKVDFAEGIWAGVSLFYPQGKNDGTVRGVEYFRCKHPYGIFVPLRKVSRSPINDLVGNMESAFDEGDEEHVHELGCGGGCDIHDKVYWNTEAVVGNKVTGVRNPEFKFYH